VLTGYLVSLPTLDGLECARWRDSLSTWGELCDELRVLNCEKSRKNLYNAWTQNRGKIRTVTKARRREREKRERAREDNSETVPKQPARRRMGGRKSCAVVHGDKADEEDGNEDKEKTNQENTDGTDDITEEEVYGDSCPLDSSGSGATEFHTFEMKTGPSLRVSPGLRKEKRQKMDSKGPTTSSRTADKQSRKKLFESATTAQDGKMSQPKQKKQLHCFNMSSINVPSWGGTHVSRTGNVKMVNTCTVDNILSILHLILSARPGLMAAMSSGGDAVNCLQEVMACFREGDFDLGKAIWLEIILQYNPNDKLWDAWGSEDGQLVSHLEGIQEHNWTTVCSNECCPRPVRLRSSKQIALK